MPEIGALHHVTAIAGDPQSNIDFYTGVLGLRLVKVTVDVHDPEVYHLWYGDAHGRPGSLLTFYCWPGAIRGSRGTGKIGRITLATPPGALPAWRARLAARGVDVAEPVTRGDGQVLAFRDPDGLDLELAATARWPLAGWGALPAAQAIRGLYGHRRAGRPPGRSAD
jgi:glyoxalase family protein